ncbi:MAG: glycosyltransferase family 2 protein [Candidatus Pacebacteria bacterium]|nr:glycosyltransferase family 2 protein [Candidatus Paceibacterota bacterium]
MKLIVTIPAYNEEKTIAKVIKEIPRNIKDIDEAKVLVINDGSTDNTVKVAKEAGADYIISNSGNQGLAYTFRRGLELALKSGADIIVNTDADFQYNQTEIPKLIQPIFKEEAEMVIGNRQVEKLDHMPFSKKYGNILISWALRFVLKNKVSDASSGFRAFSRECALRLNIFSHYTYTHETIIQCTLQRMRIAEVPVEFRKREGGKSRLIKSLWSHCTSGVSTIIRVYLMYTPLKTFLKIGIPIFLVGLAFWLRYLYFYLQGNGSGHLQSLLLGVILLLLGFQLVIMGFLADLIDANRKREEETLYMMKKQEYDKENNKENL